MQKDSFPDLAASRNQNEDASSDGKNPRSSSLASPYPSSPNQLGYQLPAEWDAHEGTWLSWPHNKEAWPGRIQSERMHSVYKFFAELVQAIAADEAVHINVNDQAMEKLARDVLKKHKVAGHIQFHPFATDNSWCRDHAATIVANVNESSSYPTRVAVDWGFNGYGHRMPRFENDNAVPGYMARAMQVPCISGGMILEGGAIDADGAGNLLASKSCLGERNPNMKIEQLEERLTAMLGARSVLWLNETIVGDATDGHVDNLTRFVAKGTVVTSVAENPNDANYRALHNNLESLQNFELASGERLQIQTINMPMAVADGKRRFPASYASFYITNHSVLVPMFDQPTDDEACGKLRELFPGRRIVGINCLDALHGLGGLHSFAQQIPVA